MPEVEFFQNSYFEFSPFRLNSAANKLKTRALGCFGRGNRGRKRSFNTVSEEKINQMMELTYQQRTEAKIKWPVKYYNDWRDMRLDQDDCDREILDANLEVPIMLTKQNLEHALCRFVCEVKKSKEEGDYPGRTLYQMVVCIQNFLKKKGFEWRLVHGL